MAHSTNAATAQQRFQTLVETHRGIIYKICHAYCRQPDDREDLAQEILLQLWRSFPSYDREARFSTWMYRVALNVAISTHRRETTRTRHVLSDEARVLEAPDPTETEPESVRLLYDRIARLDPLKRALILLYLEGQSYREIAGVLGITETNVGTQLARARHLLRDDSSATAAATTHNISGNTR